MFISKKWRNAKCLNLVTKCYLRLENLRNNIVTDNQDEWKVILKFENPPLIPSESMFD